MATNDTPKNEDIAQELPIEQEEYSQEQTDDLAREDQLPKQDTSAKAPRARGGFWQLPIWQPPNYVGYKISAVVIALMIWVFVIASQNTMAERVFTVPLEVRNLNSALAMLETTNQVQVRVQGNSGDLESLSAADIVVYIDLTGVQAGSANVEVRYTLPDNIQLISLNPTSIEVVLEQRASKVFDLTIRNNVVAAENYKLLDPIASPSQITVSGAEKYLANVASVLVNAEVTDITSNYNQNLQVKVIDFAGNDITDQFSLSPSTVNVVIPVVTDMPSKSVAVNASVVGTPAEGYQVSQVIVEPSTITAFGDLQVLNSLYYLETEPLNITGLTDNYTQTVNIIHSGDVEVSQSSVTVVVQIEPVATRTFSVQVVYAKNLASYLACDLPTVSVDVEVTGPSAAVNALTNNDIVAVIDFSGITEAGDYELELTATLPANISLVSISPGEVSVTVTEAAE